MILPSASPLSLLLGLAAAAAYAAPALAAARLSADATRVALSAAWLLHAAVLAWGMVASTPHFGFATALSITGWLVLTVYGIERQLFPQLQARCLLSGLARWWCCWRWRFRGNRCKRYRARPRRGWRCI